MSSSTDIGASSERVRVRPESVTRGPTVAGRVTRVSYTDPPPPQYGQPAPEYAGGPPPKRSVLAIVGLVLGIIGVIPCFWGCLIFSVGGIVFSMLGKKEIRDSNGAKTGEGAAKWGFILGLVGIALGVIYWILVATNVLNVSYSGDMN
jgi:hypothetical protein